jgi:hypothetical protein
VGSGAVRVRVGEGKAALLGVDIGQALTAVVCMCLTIRKTGPVPPHTTRHLGIARTTGTNQTASR